MVNQTITIVKSGANWTSAQEADQTMRTFAGADTVAFLDNAKATNDLVSFSAQLINSETLVYVREWTDAGWAAFSGRQADVNTMKEQAAAQGINITFDQPAYV